MYDIYTVRKDFPILGREVYKRPLVYLDNAATTQKPRCVVEAIANEYYSVNANVHRGVHFLSQQATDLHEAARETVRRFINARDVAEVVFTRGTTESLNLVASSYGEAFLHEGDEVIVTVMEHHSDIVPWQLLRERKGIVLKVVPMTDEGVLDLDAYEQLFTPRTRLVCVAHVSNVLGTVNPVKRMRRLPTRTGRTYWWTGHRVCRTLRWTCRTLVATLWCSAGIRCTAQRALVCFTAARTCSTACRPTRVAAR